MEKNIFRGELVQLVVEDPQTIAEAYSRWSRDSEYWRLANSNPVRSLSAKLVKERVEKELENQDQRLFLFYIRTLQEDRLIGDVELDGVQWNHGEAFVGIAIGERELWGKGYGTDAMRLILRYAFTELNLQRVSLSVFSYNMRAIHSYEKLGFIHEGCERGALKKDGRRYDLVYMGILRADWLAINGGG